MQREDIIETRVVADGKAVAVLAIDWDAENPFRLSAQAAEDNGGNPRSTSTALVGAPDCFLPGADIIDCPDRLLSSMPVDRRGMLIPLDIAGGEDRVESVALAGPLVDHWPAGRDACILVGRELLDRGEAGCMKAVAEDLAAYNQWLAEDIYAIHYFKNDDFDVERDAVGAKSGKWLGMSSGHAGLDAAREAADRGEGLPLRQAAKMRQ